MTNPIFLARGSGCADDKTQDGFKVLRGPLPEREQRVFARKSGNRICYRAYSLKLAELDRENPPENYTGDLYILISHGGGTETLRVKSAYDAGEWREMLLEMSDPLLYRTLWALYATASDASRHAEEGTRSEYAKAFVEGRLKKTRVKEGRRRVYIEQPETVPC